MPGPTLTTAEIAQLKKEAAKQQSFADSMTAGIAAKTARVAELTVADGAFKKFFDYYNDDIIGKYDAEKKALNGVYTALPITEADITGPAHADGSVRTTPTPPATDIVRVAQFDGGGTTTTLLNETQHIADQAALETAFVSGFSDSGGFNTATAKTNSVLTSASTTLKIKDTTNPLTIVNGDHLYITDGTHAAIVTITSVTDNLGGNPPYDFTYGITFLVTPSASIATNQVVRHFTTGFTNGERTTKTASDSNYQPLMNAMVAQLQADINARIARLNEELAAIAANQDPDGTAQFTTATTNDNTSKSFLTAYLVSTDISNTGLASLSTERGVRSPQITTRVSQINANYTGQTKNYYNERYNAANNRGNTSRGSLRQEVTTQTTVDTMGTYAASAQDSVDAINALLS